MSTCTGIPSFLSRLHNDLAEIFSPCETPFYGQSVIQNAFTCSVYSRYVLCRYLSIYARWPWPTTIELAYAQLLMRWSRIKITTTWTTHEVDSRSGISVMGSCMILRLSSVRFHCLPHPVIFRIRFALSMSF